MARSSARGVKPGERICVNCYNREREILSGRNARGNAPSRLQEARPLRSIAARMAVNGRPLVRRFDHVTGLREVVLRSLRTTRGQGRFSGCGRAELSKGEVILSAGGGRRTATANHMLN